MYFLPAITKNIAFHAIVLFMLGIAHSGVRIGRKTHIVDLAVGDQKSDYVAISNTLIGIVLLILGVISSLLLGYSLVAGIAVMAVLALLGASVCLKMQHVQ